MLWGVGKTSKKKRKKTSKSISRCARDGISTPGGPKRPGRDNPP